MARDVKVLGVEETLKELRKYQADKINDFKKEVKECAKDVKKVAKSKAPVLTGDTKASISFKTFDGGLSMKVYPKKPKGYKAHWHEYGTMKMKATPFMTPAEIQAEPKFKAKMKILVSKERRI